MRVMATYLYPDFTAKKKYSSYENKKINKNCKQSFEECLLNMNKKIDQQNQKRKNKYNA